VHCSFLNNPLHYAVLSDNANLVEYLVMSDAEGRILRNERNAKDLKPEALDTQGRFTNIFNNVWELSFVKNHIIFERLQALLKESKAVITETTPIGKNTPFHFAVLNGNTRALRALGQLMKPNSVNLAEMINSEGFSPLDLVQMYQSEEMQTKLLLLMNKELSVTQLAKSKNRKLSSFHQNNHQASK